MLNLLEKNAKILNLNDNINTIRASSDKFKLNSKFDIMICFGLLEHVSPQLRIKTILNCFSHLRKSGQFFIIINNSDNSFLRNNYRYRKRRYTGYQSNLIGFNWLKKVCTDYNMRYKIVASNPNYAILHYFYHHEKYINNESLRQFSINALKADMLAPPYNNMSKLFASHFIVKIRHS
jgi:hypothetical protein